MTFIIGAGKLLLSIIYFFLKLFPTRDKVSFFSRQSDEISVEYSMLIAELEADGIETKAIISQQGSSTSAFFSDLFKNTSVLMKQMYALATSRVVVTDGYSVPVSVLNHKDKLVIIQIWHSLVSIKKFGLQCCEKWTKSQKCRNEMLCMHEKYNYIISTSEEASNIYKNAMDVSNGEILNIGTPVLDYLFYGRNAIDQRPDCLDKDKKVIAYFPTFRRDKGLELKGLTDNIDFERYEFVISLHPVDNITCVDDRAKMLPEYSSKELISIADYVVTDYSGIAFEAGLQNKPIFFYVYDIDEYIVDPGLNIDILNEYEKYSSKSPVDITGMLDEEYDYDYMNEFINKYIENYDGKAVERFMSLLKL